MILANVFYLSKHATKIKYKKRYNTFIKTRYSINVLTIFERKKTLCYNVFNKCILLIKACYKNKVGKIVY